MQKHCVIAIDGPAGAGKSTAAKELARESGVLFHMHVQESEAELKDSISGTPSSSRHLSEARCSPIEVGLRW